MMTKNNSLKQFFFLVNMLNVYSINNILYHFFYTIENKIKPDTNSFKHFFKQMRNTSLE